MSGPDGIEQRTADLQERFEAEFDACDLYEQLADESLDEVVE